MKIGIDISQLAYPGTGVATYTQNLVENLLKTDKENEYLLFFSSLRKKTQISNLKIQNYNSKLKTYSFPPIFLELLWNKLHRLPMEMFMGKLDVLHTSDWLEPPSQAVKVTTVHDLAVYKYPESFAVRGGHDIVTNQKRKLAWVKKESKLIIADSLATKKDLIEILGISEEKIRVIYLAAEKTYGEREIREIREIRKKYELDRLYVLMMGAGEPRKNLARGIRAFREIGAIWSELELVIVGKYGWGEEDNLKFKIKNLKLLGYVPREDLPALYAGAEVFVYPSLYEGFGLPILEAMSCGCPVVTSNVSSLPEIAGEAGVLVDPLKIEDIAEGIRIAMNSRMELREKGLEQVKKFSWEKTTRETLAVYQEAYAHRFNRL
jgi:glycosyltransferase involved in cell wall biosynthesis